MKIPVLEVSESSNNGFSNKEINHYFHSLIFAKSQGKCRKGRIKPEVFNAFLGTLLMIINNKIMFDQYNSINSEIPLQKLKRVLAHFIL